MKRVPLHPLCLAIFPVLFLYSQNISLIPLREVIRPLLVVSGSAVFAWLLLALFVRSLERSAVLVSVVLIGLFSFGPLVSGIMGATWFESHREVVGRGWLAGLFLVAVLLAFLPIDVSRVSSFLNACGLIIVISSGGALVRYGVTQKAYMSPFTGGDSSGDSVPPASRLPDIFYIVLDGYGGQSGLKKAFGFSNDEFLQDLKSLGFYVAERSYSNYGQTDQSLASVLNMNYLDQLIPKNSLEGLSRSYFHEMIAKNLVAEHLKRWGYRFVVVSSGYLQIESSSADVVFGGKEYAPLLEALLWKMTPLSPPSRRGSYLYEEHRDNIVSAFEYLKGLALPTASPRFVFAHLMVPHPPFVFDRYGNGVPSKRFFGIYDGSHYLSAGGTPEEYAKGYVEQVLFVNREVLRWVMKLISDSTIPPIIILQGDHGAKLRYDYESQESTDFEESYSILNAYYVPESIRKRLYDSITPVNSFRVVLSALLGLPLDLLPDEHYYSTWDAPFTFARVTGELRPVSGVAKRN